MAEDGILDRSFKAWSRNLANLDRPSAASLIAANLVPFVGLLFWQWELRKILLLYWAENAVIGGYNVLKMIVIGRWSAIPLVLFFLLHFSLFMTIHLVFVLLLAGGWPFEVRIGSESLFGGARDALTTDVGAGFVVLLISHGSRSTESSCKAPRRERFPCGFSCSRPIPGSLRCTSRSSAEACSG